jgi:hypothetical protein
MLAALLRRLSRDRRTSLGEPVDPEVLSRRARSGCRSWALSSALGGPPIGVLPQDHVGVVGVDQLLQLRGPSLRDQQRDVAVLHGGEVGRDRLRGVGALDEHQPAGAAEHVGGEVGGTVGQVGIADLARRGVQGRA